MTSDRDSVRAGFIPLVDAAPLIVAHEKGFAAREGLDLVLSRETSWATIRDRLAVSHLDAAHALAPLPLAGNLGLSPLPGAHVVPIALGFGANTVTVSKTLWAALEQHGATDDLDAAQALRALSLVVGERRGGTNRALTFGIVHQHSAQRYELAYWLAAGGIGPGHDVELVVLPPSLMPMALASGSIDGFCAGEPWGSVAAASGAGCILTTKAHIWRSSPDKVLTVRRDWADANETRLSALVRAIYQACLWCDVAENRSELAALLGRPEYLAVDASAVMPGLSRRLQSANGIVRPVAGFLNFAERAASFPWSSHALWFLAQMSRWGETEVNSETIAIARATYRPDLYRLALADLGVAMPSANAKLEGALSESTPVGSTTGRLVLGPDGFFDGLVFDPDHINDYVALLQTRDRQP